MASKDVVKAEVVEAESVIEAAAGIVRRKGDVISDYLPKEREDTDTTSAQIHRSIIEKILASADLDSVLEVFEAEKLDLFEGRQIVIESAEFNDSDFDEGPPVYTSLMVRDVENGTKHLINSGEQAIMAQVMKFQELNAFPLTCTVWLNAKPNRYGRRLARITKWVPRNG